MLDDIDIGWKGSAQVHIIYRTFIVDLRHILNSVLILDLQMLNNLLLAASLRLPLLKQSITTNTIAITNTIIVIIITIIHRPATVVDVPEALPAAGCRTH